MKKALVLSYPLNAQRRLLSDWADVSLICLVSVRWAHTHFVGFVMSQLIRFINTDMNINLKDNSFRFPNINGCMLHKLYKIENAKKAVSAWPISTPLHSYYSM